MSPVTAPGWTCLPAEDTSVSAPVGRGHVDMMTNPCNHFSKPSHVPSLYSKQSRLTCRSRGPSFLGLLLWVTGPHRKVRRRTCWCSVTLLVNKNSFAVFRVINQSCQSTAVSLSSDSYTRLGLLCLNSLAFIKLSLTTVLILSDNGAAIIDHIYKRA